MRPLARIVDLDQFGWDDAASGSWTSFRVAEWVVLCWLCGCDISGRCVRQEDSR